MKTKYLSHYLPYGLDLKITAENGDEEVVKLTPENIEWTQKECPETVDAILRPFSDLTKEIEINGQLITPLLEIAAIATTSSPESWTIKNGEAVHKHIDGWKCYVALGNWDVVVTKSDKWKDFSNVSGQIYIFQKLLSWNFDVFLLQPEMMSS